MNVSATLLPHYERKEDTFSLFFLAHLQDHARGRGAGNSHVILPARGPDDIFCDILCGQGLEPLVYLLGCLFIPPESSDGEGLS